ncbi:DUF2520 domain-containing protein [Rhodohalobacter sp. SW132]|uniref:Rossmann-like and DUF2520 domain-containing protein n=1 Tax=Rhodohalobacter sp. SW132 TaxID=2293433 RepID=UPI000E228879|nr:DUF2520 domain-containing protein [Rhodohalobacter sp. SW132]REL38181.1 DUF2520 domain-containing protein [Rhodohalobacter sp. SW132]
MMGKSSAISVIGPGALGSALIKLINKNPKITTLQSVWGSKSFDSYSVLDGEIIHQPNNSPQSVSDFGRIIFITTPDDKIADIAQVISELSVDWSGYSFVHFSGSFNSDLLHSLKKKGAKTASLHPLQTFTKGDAEERFHNIWFTFEGDTSLFSELESLVKAAGARVKKISSEQKKAMHLAAVMASNYMVSLMDAVREVTDLFELEDGVAMLEPLIHQTTQNIFEKGIPDSLSGPVARGDQQTIKSHLDQIKNHPELTNLYSLLGLRAAKIALNNGRLGKDQYQELKTLFSEKSKL